MKPWTVLAFMVAAVIVISVLPSMGPLLGLVLIAGLFIAFRNGISPGRGQISVRGTGQRGSTFDALLAIGGMIYMLTSESVAYAFDYLGLSANIIAVAIVGAVVLFTLSPTYTARVVGTFGLVAAMTDAFASDPQTGAMLFVVIVLALWIYGAFKMRI